MYLLREIQIKALCDYFKNSFLNQTWWESYCLKWQLKGNKMISKKLFLRECPKSVQVYSMQIKPLCSSCGCTLPTEWFIFTGKQTVFAPLAFLRFYGGKFSSLFWLCESHNIETTVNRNIWICPELDFSIWSKG